MTDVHQLTEARRWVLECGKSGEVAGGYSGPSVITDFKTGVTTYGARSRVVEKCKEAGWLDANGRTTGAGLAALDRVSTTGEPNG